MPPGAGQRARKFRDSVPRMFGILTLDPRYGRGDLW
jgi:hypothetical protein